MENRTYFMIFYIKCVTKDKYQTFCQQSNPTPIYAMTFKQSISAIEIKHFNGRNR